MTRPRTLLAAVLLCMLAACAGPQLLHSQLAALDKGMSSAEAVARLKLAPRWTDEAGAGGRSFSFHGYQLYNGIQSDAYLLAYERDRLLYWGYVAEFRRQPDRDLSAALTEVLARHPAH